MLQNATTYLESPKGRSAIILEAKKRGTSKSDLLLLAESIDDKLSEAGIEVQSTPRYVKRFQIDETVFEHVLKDEVSYLNPRAIEYDIDSVRSIYVIRANTPTPSVEKARAVFVTSNTKFAKAAWEYGKKHEASKDVSSVIADFSLANMAWLKGPMGAVSIPTTQVLAFSYAALKPSSELLGKYMKEMDKLEQKGTITARDHQLLRSSPLAQDKLIHLTLGEDAALTAETVIQTLERVSIEIKQEESEKFIKEQQAHQTTYDALCIQQDFNQKICNNLYWSCHRRASLRAWILSTVIVITLVSSIPGLGLSSANPILSRVPNIGFIVFILLTLASLVWGFNVRRFHKWMQHQCLTWLYKRQTKALGLSNVGRDLLEGIELNDKP